MATGWLTTMVQWVSQLPGASVHIQHPCENKCFHHLPSIWSNMCTSPTKPWFMGGCLKHFKTKGKQMAQQKKLSLLFLNHVNYNSDWHFQPIPNWSLGITISDPWPLGARAQSSGDHHSSLPTGAITTRRGPLVPGAEEPAGGSFQNIFISTSFKCVKYVSKNRYII